MTTKTKAAPVAVEAAEDNRSKRQAWREGSSVRLTEKGATNPKKPNSMSAERYAILLRVVGNAENGQPSVATLFKAGYRMDDIRHDSAHGFIELIEAA